MAQERTPVLIPFPEDWKDRFERGEILFEEITLVIIAKSLEEAKRLAEEAKTKFENSQEMFNDVENLRREITDSIYAGKEADALLGLLFLASRMQQKPAIYAWVVPIFMASSGQEVAGVTVLSNSQKSGVVVQDIAKLGLDRVRELL